MADDQPRVGRKKRGRIKSDQVFWGGEGLREKLNNIISKKRERKKTRTPRRVQKKIHGKESNPRKHSRVSWHESLMEGRVCKKKKPLGRGETSWEEKGKSSREQGLSLKKSSRGSARQRFKASIRVRRERGRGKKENSRGQSKLKAVRKECILGYPSHSKARKGKYMRKMSESDEKSKESPSKL